ncbi:MAG: hypothetical protein H6822_13110 [Planctomycetaceae bacterium]|nr:hypothetical protein [Planctomycetales bacterium]MCB9923117.1 hypothetical protein [Planctomycetaceae bacterium]
MSKRYIPVVASLMILFVANAMIVTVASGQAAAPAAYKQYPPDPKLLDNKKAGQQQVGRIMRGTQPFDDVGKRVLDAYYKDILFREFTTKDNWGKLPELRNEILKDLRGARNVQAFQHVVNLAYQQMRSFTQSRFQLHPVVRYNAMLLLGELNAVERGARGADGRATAYPDPLPAALDAMIAEYKSPDQIDAVRIAALVGIDRHAKLNLARPENRRIPGPQKKIVVDEMIALLNNDPPAGRSSDGHTWMQRRAIDILAALGMVGAYPAANTALETIVANDSAPISLRCTAAEALAQWTPSNNKINAGEVSKNLGLIAVKACKDELDRIAALVAQAEEMERLRELIKKPHPAATGQFGGMSGGSGGAGEEMYGGDEMYAGGGDEGYSPEMDMGAMYGQGMYGGTGGGLTPAIPTDPRVVWSQRRLKYQLTCVKKGLGGMMLAGKAGQHEKSIAQIAQAVDLALSLTDPPAEKPNLEGLTEQIQKGVRGLAFLAPAAAVIDVAPVTELPPGAEPPAAAPPEGAVTAPADAALPPGAETAPTELPPGL